MLHAALIALHALSGLVAFTAGCLALTRRSFLTPYLAALAATLVFLIAAVATDWPALETPVRALFAALVGLGLVVGWQGLEARRALPGPADPMSPRYLDHLGFTLIALFDAFAIILAIDVGAPAPLTVAVGVAGVVAGHTGLVALKRRLSGGRRGSPRPAGSGSSPRRSG